jgi:hypothetical protein
VQRITLSFSFSLSLSLIRLQCLGKTSWRCVGHLTNSKLPFPPLNPHQEFKQLIKIPSTDCEFILYLAAGDWESKGLFGRFLVDFKTS